MKTVELKAVLPEVSYDTKYKLVEINGENWAIEGVWENPRRWHEKAMTYLAIADYLDNLKPKLPTEPGSVIRASKVQGWTVNPKRGVFLSLSVTGVWNGLDNNFRGIRAELIEEWVSVTLVPNVEES